MRITEQINVSNSIIILTLLLLTSVLVMTIGFFSNNLKLIYIGTPATLLSSWLTIIKLITDKS